MNYIMFTTNTWTFMHAATTDLANMTSATFQLVRFKKQSLKRGQVYKFGRLAEHDTTDMHETP